MFGISVDKQVTIPNNNLNCYLMMGSCISLMASTFFGSNMTPTGVQVIKETKTLSLINTYSTIRLNACISSVLHCSRKVLITKYLYIISYTYNTSAVLKCLVNLSLEDVLSHHESEKHSHEFVPLKWCIESCHEWWCCIQLHIPVSPFCISFRKIGPWDLCWFG